MAYAKRTLANLLLLCLSVFKDRPDRGRKIYSNKVNKSSNKKG